MGKKACRVCGKAQEVNNHDICFPCFANFTEKPLEINRKEWKSSILAPGHNLKTSAKEGERIKKAFLDGISTGMGAGSDPSLGKVQVKEVNQEKGIIRAECGGFVFVITVNQELF